MTEKRGGSNIYYTAIVERIASDPETGLSTITIMCQTDEVLWAVYTQDADTPHGLPCLAVNLKEAP